MFHAPSDFRYSYKTGFVVESVLIVQQVIAVTFEDAAHFYCTVCLKYLTKALVDG